MSAATLLCLFASFFSFYLITVALCLQFLCKFIGCVGPAGWIAIGASFASSHHWYAVLFGYLLFLRWLLVYQVPIFFWLKEIDFLHIGCPDLSLFS
jgi:hypothetical protein